ncbi:MAG: ABC transporter ATP-binding protein [Cytophagaceae bacterium]|nr:ABC transporter ATP-binding protein [Cytophagaceae bacterium]|tara:strand:+ start:2222 stop:3913 length:1692 start_codon:yes stop_codon:yes gene_type:complete
MERDAILKVNDLAIAFKHEGHLTEVIHKISFELYEDEILGIVGESGSGKSVSNLAILGLLQQKLASITSGKIIFEDSDILQKNEKELQRLRGNDISMIFQEPMSSLNPSMKCGKQVQEILLQHKNLSRSRAREEVINLFDKVKLPRPEAIYSSFPHEISGGQKQRVMIAMAIACEPKILIADEPTTALDVTVQKEIILLLKELQQKNGMSVIFISHDLALVSEFANRVLVMYQGNIVEQGTAQTIFKDPQHDYTKALVHARPPENTRPLRLPTVSDFLGHRPRAEDISAKARTAKHEKIYDQQPLLEIKNVDKTYFSNAGFLRKPSETKAVNQVNFKIYPGETLGLVGESGCGKSTLGNVILQLDKATQGQIFYKGEDITHIKPANLKKLRRDIQIIFQDPYSSLNPRITVGRAIVEVMQVHGLYENYNERKKEAIHILQQVGLSAEHYSRYPHEFSGGQRQRVGIARTIALKPRFIVCDESVSALDISVQAQVLNLLNDLKEELGFTYLFISHDLAVVKFMADRLLVMREGKIVEAGDPDIIYSNPTQQYTRELIDAIPKGI